MRINRRPHAWIRSIPLSDTVSNACLQEAEELFAKVAVRFIGSMELGLKVLVLKPSSINTDINEKESLEVDHEK